MSSFEEAIQSERQSSPHRRLRDATSSGPPGVSMKGSTGVIWTTEKAVEKGFEDHPEEWANLGQGAPEAGDNIPGCRARPTTIPITEEGREYASTAGLKKLRQAVADLYNAEYRVGLASQYTWENVCIVPGGRAGLIRIASIISTTLLGYFIPDYTAYNEVLSLFKDFVPIPTPLDEADGYHIHPDKVREELRRGISVLLTSNPRNPTGELLQNPDLAELQDLCRGKCTLIMDEFYSGYYYPDKEKDFGKTISAAANVIDVDKDDIFILDGLTKKFRLPGWRIAWVVAPKTFIKGLKSCGSYLDGGTNVPLQEAAISLLNPAEVKEETIALQRHFKNKRDYVVQRLEKMGFKFQRVPKSTFYIWLDLSELPSPKLQHGIGFLEECLKEKVIVVPGVFFDVNPSARRDLFDSPCHHFVRLSYGPEMHILEKGLDGIERVIQRFKN